MSFIQRYCYVWEIPNEFTLNHAECLFLSGLWKVHQQQRRHQARQPKQQKSGAACQVSSVFDNRSCLKITAFHDCYSSCGSVSDCQVLWHLAQEVQQEPRRSRAGGHTESGHWMSNLLCKNSPLKVLRVFKWFFFEILKVFEWRLF